MSNVISFSRPRQTACFEQQSTNLITLFSQNRRDFDDVYWLKENAELLSILNCTGVQMCPDDLNPLAQFYADLPERLSFFPQYYRFLLSLCLDYEDLSGVGNLGEGQCAWVRDQGLAEAELSDLQRAEAQRLLSRRGLGPKFGQGVDAGLEARLRRFIARSATFAVPNKKAAYELTHIVFYLSEYGQRDPQLGGAAIQSLKFAGLLAYLDQNADLLAEICTALRYANQTPSAIWERFVSHALASFTPVVTENNSTGPICGDGYHEYLVANWMAAVAHISQPLALIPQGRVAFHRPNAVGPLRQISACMYHLSSARSGDWGAMRGIVEAAVDADGYDILHAAQQSTGEFEAFFEGFSRMSIAR